MSNSANENISQVAGQDINQTVSGDHVSNANNKTEIIEKDFKRQSSKSGEFAREITFFSTDENMTMQSGKDVKFNSAEKSKLLA